jgi:hypothetical protein
MKMMTEQSPCRARLKRFAGNVTISLGAVAVFLTAVAGVAVLVFVFGAAARLLIGWWECFPK